MDDTPFTRRQEPRRPIAIEAAYPLDAFDRNSFRPRLASVGPGGSLPRSEPRQTSCGCSVGRDERLGRRNGLKYWRGRAGMEVGLIGCGGMGMSLAGSLNATGVARVAAVADVDAERAQVSAEKLGARAFTD